MVYLCTYRARIGAHNLRIFTVKVRKKSGYTHSESKIIKWGLLVCILLILGGMLGNIQMKETIILKNNLGAVNKWCCQSRITN